MSVRGRVVMRTLAALVLVAGAAAGDGSVGASANGDR